MIVHLSDRAVISIKGEDTEHFLQGIITNNMRHLATQPAIYACLLTPQGKFIYDFFVVKQEEGVMLDVDAEVAEKLLSRLRIYRLRSKVTLELCADHKVIAGDELPNGYTDPRYAALGKREIVPVSFNAEWSPAEIYEERRCALAIPVGGKDMLPEHAFPLDYGLDSLHAIDFDKGCYVGQEVTARTKHRGTLRKRVYAVTGNAALPDEETDILAAGKKIGELRSSFKEKGLALIRVDDLAAVGDAECKAGDVVVTLTLPVWAV